MIRLCLAGALFLGAIAGACRTEPPMHGAVLEPPSLATEFTLTDQHGRPFTLGDARGSIVLLYFGFTACPDICPTTLGTIKAALMPLGADTARVQVAVVTVDGERDTPERLAAYLDAFDPAFLGLTGTPEELAEVYAAYGIEVVRRDLPDSALDYTIDHTASLSIIDTNGLVREVFFYGTPVEHITADLRLLLSEPQHGRLGDHGREAPRADSATVRLSPTVDTVDGPAADAAVGTAYLTIHGGSNADTLLGIHSELFETVELHESRMEGTMMRMDRVPQIRVPASGQLRLEPGGPHAMLFGLTRAASPGDVVTLTLVFESAGEIPVAADVLGP